MPPSSSPSASIAPSSLLHPLFCSTPLLLIIYCHGNDTCPAFRMYNYTKLGLCTQWNAYQQQKPVNSPFSNLSPLSLYTLQPRFFFTACSLSNSLSLSFSCISLPPACISLIIPVREERVIGTWRGHRHSTTEERTLKRSDVETDGDTSKGKEWRNGYIVSF